MGSGAAEAPETAVLAAPGEAMLTGRAADPSGALAALNLRVAILEANAVYNAGGAPDASLPRAILAVARAQFSMRAFATAVASARRVLSLVSGRSALGAKALLLAGQAAVQLGDVNRGLALYAQVSW